MNDYIKRTLVTSIRQASDHFRVILLTGSPLPSGGKNHVITKSKQVGAIPIGYI
jgi:hypothetical protein